MPKHPGRTGLEAFLKDSDNSVTRERIFYNRLYYDLKLAAARRDYALTMYEPEVDRDGYDVVVDDGDETRFIQLKTLLRTSKTTVWDIRKRFMQPDLAFHDELGIAPADCGKGGAVVLIDADISVPDPSITYWVTDYFLMRILSSGMLARSGAKKGGIGPRGVTADATWKSLHRGSSKDKVRLNKSSFVRVLNADALLAILGLHSTIHCHAPAWSFLAAKKAGFRVDTFGKILPMPNGDKLPNVLAQTCADEFLTAAADPKLARHPDL